MSWRWWIKNWGLALKIVSALLSVGAMVTLTWWGLKTQDNASAIAANASTAKAALLGSTTHADMVCDLRLEVQSLRHSVETFNLKNRLQMSEKER